MQSVSANCSFTHTVHSLLVISTALPAKPAILFQVCLLVPKDSTSSRQESVCMLLVVRAKLAHVPLAKEAVAVVGNLQGNAKTQMLGTRMGCCTLHGHGLPA